MNQSMQKKPVLLITGAEGLIGSRLVNTFSEEYDVVAFDLEPTMTFLVNRAPSTRI